MVTTRVRAKPHCAEKLHEDIIPAYEVNVRIELDNFFTER